MLDWLARAGMNDGVSAAMIVKPASVSSWPCMTRSPSAPSVPYSLKRLTTTSPPRMPR